MKSNPRRQNIALLTYSFVKKVVNKGREGGVVAGVWWWVCGSRMVCGTVRLAVFRDILPLLRVDGPLHIYKVFSSVKEIGVYRNIEGRVWKDARGEHECRECRGQVVEAEKKG